ncbi:adenylate/guanylate cyclase domain-containing protein [Nocardioides limicola]|uniref:adenylate/guanylate cyclase domain-containing protein n=1 Tax=Nocardioides limicola TaxID=2803368 RepID=UPI0027DAE1D0|nr:adenylate/guanylate cyclase domain-containing protein [Nocardioides sp. DJM-14]
MSTSPPDSAAEGPSRPEIALNEVIDSVEVALLGSRPSLTRLQVAEQSGVPLEVAEELWHLLGFAHLGDEVVAFTDRDVEALRVTWQLVAMGVIDAESQAALVRTWGRSFARLAEWQTNLLAGLAARSDDPAAQLESLVVDVLPRVEQLQNHIWRRHLLASASRLVITGGAGDQGLMRAICFIDIVGYTTRSKNLTEGELVDWIEYFEQEATAVVVDHGGQVIKMIGDEIFFATDDVVAAAEVALELTARGADEEDRFPAVRAGIAWGEVVSRLGDLLGPTVNIAARLTSVARPGSVLIDRAAYEALRPQEDDDTFDAEAIAENVAKVFEALTPKRAKDDDSEAPGPAAPLEIGPDDPTESLEVIDLDDHEEHPESPYRFRRMRRVSVKGYSRMETWVLRRADQR